MNKTNFGKKIVASKTKKILIKKLFNSASKQYDLMNDLMSVGLHRSWKRKMISLINVSEKSIILDLAAGSGDLANLIKKKSKCQCILYDANTKMLEKAKKKINNGIFISGKAENLPFKSNTFDYILVGFGLRNFSDLNMSLIEAKRVLKKGGFFVILEFSEINSNLLRKLFYFYGKIIPKYAGLLLNKKFAYNYLIESIRQFPNQIEVSKELKKKKFHNINVIDILDGLAAIHICEK